jgi:hypothetical protein
LIVFFASFNNHSCRADDLSITSPTNGGTLQRSSGQVRIEGKYTTLGGRYIKWYINGVDANGNVTDTIVAMGEIDSLTSDGTQQDWSATVGGLSIGTKYAASAMLFNGGGNLISQTGNNIFTVVGTPP